MLEAILTVTIQRPGQDPETELVHLLLVGTTLTQTLDDGTTITGDVIEHKAELELLLRRQTTEMRSAA